VKRLERGIHIRGVIKSRDEEFGYFQYTPSRLARIIWGEGWTARMHTPFFPTSGSQIFKPAFLIGESASTVELPNRIGLWLDNGPKVMTIEWYKDLVRLRSFKRGVWESELFGLPPYEGRALELAEHSRRGRARRW
jgi:hypothetical protein